MHCFCRKLLASTKVITQSTRHVSHKQKIRAFFERERHLKETLEYIPRQYLDLKRYNLIDNLYLIDVYVARNICTHILPSINEGSQMVAETGAGLGLVAAELLDNNVKQVRLYECCPEFQAELRDFNNIYPGRVELFSRNLFHLGRISTQDKYDRGNRVTQLLKNVPRRAWHEGPCMTVFGCMVNRSFINYLLKMMAMQAEIVAHGRIQLFAIMRPSDYVTLTAGPDNDLHTYQPAAVLFQTLFQHKLIDKYPRVAFLPWESRPVKKNRPRFSQTVDVDQMYLVKIVPKRTLPLSVERILPFYFFVKQLFGRGTKRVVPTIEKWLPGCGPRLLLPSKKYRHYFDDMNIYTTFGEMTPQEILSLFQEMLQHEGYNGSAFDAMIQSELVKYETRETDSQFLLEDTLDSFEVEDLEKHFD